ncbi:MAG TPA: branched-chain amino acid transport system II carrier protein [Candidatus Babeliales bacterium]|nr:branched-chain amino acid transport system II carrier protein [Candidatus Babeliales bacterium]
MKRLLKSDVVTIGLAIFSMFFGAGNLMFPIGIGIASGKYTAFGMAGLLLSAVVLPLIGLVGMILFDGDYRKFFARLGEIPGALLLFACIIVVGPGIAIPRIVTLSYEMMSPFLPSMPVYIFTFLFLGITFLLTFRESKIVNVLGNYISPTLLVSLMIIIVKGLWTAEAVVPTTAEPMQLFVGSFREGFGTLDLLGSVFFCSIILLILRQNMGVKTKANQKQLALTGLKAGLLGISLLGLVYIGMSLLGTFHGHGLDGNLGQLFSLVSFRILGSYGALIIGLAVLMACLSTSIALSAVVAEYVEHDIFKKKIKFIPSLIIVSLLSIPLSVYGLSAVLQLTAGPIVDIGYPIIIALTFCNIAYKVFNFKPVKTPVALVGLLALVYYNWSSISTLF